MAMMRGALVVGLAAMAATGTTAPAFAAPDKKPVTPQQCAASEGKVQRASDGVGTCVGGTQYDGHVISDVSTTRQQAAPQQPQYAPQQGYYPAPQYAPAPQYYYAPAPAPPARATPSPSSSTTTPSADSDSDSDSDSGSGSGSGSDSDSEPGRGSGADDRGADDD